VTICALIASPRPVPLALLVKNGSNSRGLLLRNADAGIFDFNDRRGRACSCPHRQGSSTRHRVDRVEHQIQEYLAQLVAVADDRRQLGRRREHHTDGSIAQIETGQGQRSFQQTVQILRCELAALRAIKLAHTLDDAGNALQLLGRQLEIRRLASGGRAIFFQQEKAVAHRVQRIVDLVCDGCRQLADGRQPRRLQHTGLRGVQPLLVQLPLCMQVG